MGGLNRIAKLNVMLTGCKLYNSLIDGLGYNFGE